MSGFCHYQMIAKNECPKSRPISWHRYAQCSFDLLFENGKKVELFLTKNKSYQKWFVPQKRPLLSLMKVAQCVVFTLCYRFYSPTILPHAWLPRRRNRGDTLFPTLSSQRDRKNREKPFFTLFFHRKAKIKSPKRQKYIATAKQVKHIARFNGKN